MKQMRNENVFKQPAAKPWLASLLLRRPRLHARFLESYRQLRRLPRWTRRQLTRHLALPLAGVALALALGHAPVSAATITVVNGQVAINANGSCSLIEAIANANDTTTGQPHTDCAAGNPAGADTIQLPTNGSFTLTSQFSYTNFAFNGLPIITSEITIAGNGSTIARSGAAPRFRILAVQGTGNLTLNNTKLTGGRVDDDFAGGIFNFGTLAINDSAVTYNWSDAGGGLANFGTADIQDSTFDLNVAIPTFAGGAGGAIFNGGTLEIQGSAVIGNVAQQVGGGISSNDDLTVINSTVSDNWAKYSTGGGIQNLGTATITNATITDNVSGGTGGGTFNTSAGTMTLERSLVSGNLGAGAGREAYNQAGGTITVNDHNLFGRSSSSGVSGFTPGATDIVPTQAIGGILNTTLANNGGPTKNHALVANSPAIDVAPSADCAVAPNNVDQRGLPRNVDGNASASANECDSGAFESQGASGSQLLFVSPTAAGNVGGIAVTPQDILAYDLNGDTWAMYFDGSDVGVTKILSGFTQMADGSWLLSFKANQPLTGLGTITPWDVVRFVPSSTGNDTAGSFTWWIDGSDVGMTAAAEKIDALEVLANGKVLISTTGNLAVPKPGGGTLKSQDEDLTAFTPTTTGMATTGTWALYFNGTAINGLGAEDVVGAHVDEATGDLYLSILGAFNVGGVSGNGKDILLLHPSGGGYTVDPTHFWRGSQHGFNLNLGGIELEN